MSGEAERRFFARAAHTRNQIGPARAKVMDGVCEPGIRQHRRKRLDAGPLVSGRIDRIDADEVLRQFQS
jgi:hypothetical protein